jgi:guanylate kinase
LKVRPTVLPIVQSNYSLTSRKTDTFQIHSQETLDSFMSFCASDTSVAPAGGAMAIFLGPATMEEHEKRLRAYMTESKESIAAQVLVAEQDLKQGVDSQVFDAFLTVADFHLQNSTEKDTEALHETVDALAELISGKRPDMIKPSDSAAEAGKVIRPLVELLLKEFPKRFAKVKTTTTRLPRDWETGEAGVLGDSETNLEKEQPETDSVGPRYHFVSKETFEADVANGKFLEHTTRSPASTDEARAAGETAGETPTETVSPETFSYGVAMDAFESACENGAVPILDVDVFGVRALKLLYPEGVFVCVAPADVEALERKIRDGGGG